MYKRYKISHAHAQLDGKVKVPGSKSESNRLLILKELYFPKLTIDNHSSSNDTQIMLRLLSQTEAEKNVEDAGTVMRFLTALYAVKSGEITLHGTDRMHQRPIGVLVDALRELGADIEFLEKNGFPPLKISGKPLIGGKVSLDGSTSSQFVSALMMIGPSMEKGLIIDLTGNQVSRPYIDLTASLMLQLGLSVSVLESEIVVEPFDSVAPSLNRIKVEPDWSSASYWYTLCLLSKTFQVELLGYQSNSLQGDAQVLSIFESLGVKTEFTQQGVRLKKTTVSQLERVEMNLVKNPDLAQTIVVALAALGVPSLIKGLQTLKIKETDRLVALKTELEKCGAKIIVGESSLEIIKGIDDCEECIFSTWGDHRMAMALAPLALVNPIIIHDPEVVSKSYPSFWKDLQEVGFKIEVC